MAKKRTPQTFEKRARERDKQMKREAKQADRLARSAAKREAKQEGGEERDGNFGATRHAADVEDPRDLVRQEAERKGQ